MLYCLSVLIERVINDFDNLILPLGIEHSNETTVDDNCAPSQPALAATGKNSRSRPTIISILSLDSAASVIDALDELESRLSSVYNQDNTSTGIDNSETVTDGHAACMPRSSTPTGIRILVSMFNKLLLLCSRSASNSNINYK